MEVAARRFLLSAVLLLTVPRSLSLYYQMRPTISIMAGSFQASDVGNYDPGYSSTKKDISNAELYVIEDDRFGCPGYYSPAELNITFPQYFVVMLPFVDSGVPCSEFRKAKTAQQWGADAVIFRYDPDDPHNGRLSNKPTDSPQLSGITIVTMELAWNPALLENSPGLVSIVAHYHQFQTSQTFYFIVFAFCILMLLSCLWFVMSYMKRCHYIIQRRRRRVRDF